MAATKPKRHSTVNHQGRTVVPIAVRRALGLRTGEALEWEVVSVGGYARVRRATWTVAPPS